MLTVGGTVELGLDVDARRGGEGEAVADVDLSLGGRRKRRGWRVDWSRVARFYARMSNFADGLLELRPGQRFGFGQCGVAFEGEFLNGFTVGVGGRDLASRGDLERVFGEAGG